VGVTRRILALPADDPSGTPSGIRVIVGIIAAFLIRRREREEQPVRFAAPAGGLAIAATSCGGSGSGATGDVIVTMDDLSLEATPGTFDAGDVTFGIQNDGPASHEFVVIRTDGVHPRVNLSLFLPTARGNAHLRLFVRRSADQRFSAS
jgi:hypothetical protein